MNKNKKVIVGLSGGVDSSVTALLLQQQGYQVTAVYMQNWEIENENQLHKGQDSNKDQSYFLYTLGQPQLAKCLFPLGNYHKQEVREIAKAASLPTHNKKDSTGICFVGERKFKTFLNEFLLAKPG